VRKYPNLFEKSQLSAVAVLVLVPLFSAAVWTTYGQLWLSGASKLLFAPEACPYPATYRSESQIRYTGIPPIDHFGCVGAEMMKASLFRHVQPFTIHLHAALAAPTMVINIEGLRKDGPSRWFPFLVTLGGMSSNAGIALTLGWLFMFLSLYRHARRPLTREMAEAMFISLIFGYVLPSAVMIATVNEYAIFVWMQYPNLITAVQALWLYIRPATNESGFFTTQFALFTVLFTSSIVHLTMLVNYAPRTSFDDFVGWLPSWLILNVEALTTENLVLSFLQWDAIFSYTSGIVAGFLYADSWPEFLLYGMATPMVLLGFGPGAVIAAMWMWREWKLSMLEELEIATLKAQGKKEE
jgi:hypothetical protein